MHNQNSKSFLIRDLLGDLINHQQQNNEDGKTSVYFEKLSTVETQRSHISNILKYLG